MLHRTLAAAVLRHGCVAPIRNAGSVRNVTFAAAMPVICSMSTAPSPLRPGRMTPVNTLSSGRVRSRKISGSGGKRRLRPDVDHVRTDRNTLSRKAGANQLLFREFAERDEHRDVIVEPAHLARDGGSQGIPIDDGIVRLPWQPGDRRDDAPETIQRITLVSTRTSIVMASGRPRWSSEV